MISLKNIIFSLGKFRFSEIVLSDRQKQIQIYIYRFFFVSILLLFNFCSSFIFDFGIILENLKIFFYFQ